METFTSVVIGKMGAPTFLGYYFLALFTAVGAFMWRASKKAKSAKGTPQKFNFGFFIQDNLMSFLANIMGIAIGIRLSDAYLGSELSDVGMAAVACVIGISSNQVFIWLEKLQRGARKK